MKAQVIERRGVCSEVRESGRQLVMKLPWNESVSDWPGDETKHRRPWRSRRPSTPILGGASLEQVANALAGIKADFNAERRLQLWPEVGARAAVSITDISCGHDQG